MTMREAVPEPFPPPADTTAEPHPSPAPIHGSSLVARRPVPDTPDTSLAPAPATEQSLARPLSSPVGQAALRRLMQQMASEQLADPPLPVAAGSASPEPPDLPATVNEGGDSPAPPPTTPDELPSPSQPPLSPVQRAIGTVVSDTTYAERNPGRPDVDLRLHMGGHGSRLDWEDVPDILQNPATKPDIYCYENASGPALHARYRAVAAAPGPRLAARLMVRHQSLEDIPMRKLWISQAIRGLWGSNIVIGHFDLKTNRRDAQLHDKLSDHTFYLAKGNTLDEHLDDYLANARQQAKYELRRDRIMMGPTPPKKPGRPVRAGRFETEMGRLVDRHPELAAKPVNRVLDTHGAAHSWLFHEARASGVRVTRTFPHLPFVYPRSIELNRTLQIGIEPGRDLLKKCFIEDKVLGLLPSFPLAGIRAHEGYRYSRMVTDSLGASFAEKLFAATKAGRPELATINEELLRIGAKPLALKASVIRRQLKQTDDAYRNKVRQVERTMARRLHGPSLSRSLLERLRAFLPNS